MHSKQGDLMVPVKNVSVDNKSSKSWKGHAVCVQVKVLSLV